MKKGLFFCLLTLFCLETLIAGTPKTIMLVLGSDKPDVLETRIQLAYKLYQIQPIDKIIVSGGCGAHASSICEATLMFDGLVKRGIDSTKIYKEENAKSTVQNYVFSRVLKDEFNQNIIQKGDTVFVVSDHWHAISVASRLKKYDDVQAKFFIEGDILPKVEDKLDYVSIMNGESDNNVFVRKALWLTPQVSWKTNGATNYVMDSMVYCVHDNKILKEGYRDDIFKQLVPKSNTEDWTFIDSGKSWFVKISDNLFEVDKISFKVSRMFRWSDMIKDLPSKWLINGYNTGVIVGNRLILFSNDAVLFAVKKGRNYVFEKEGPAKELINNWPFSWGKSNVVGVSLDKENKRIILYRNREYLYLDNSLNVIQQPVKLNVKWVNNQ